MNECLAGISACRQHVRAVETGQAGKCSADCCRKKGACWAAPECEGCPKCVSSKSVLFYAGEVIAEEPESQYQGNSEGCKTERLR